MCWLSISQIQPNKVNGRPSSLQFNYGKRVDDVESKSCKARCFWVGIIPFVASNPIPYRSAPRYAGSTPHGRWPRITPRPSGSASPPPSPPGGPEGAWNDSG